jgi:diacylglycerol kinase family enzyme
MRVIVLLNARAGATPSPGEDEIRGAFAAAGAEADIRSIPADSITAAARQAATEAPDAVVAAGGDGTVSAVAAALIGSTVPLGVLPSGTLNHFAKDLALPSDLRAAVAAIVAGRARSVDVAEVNGIPFINNSSIGLYPHIVAHRDEQRQRLGRNKWLAMFFAICAIFTRYPLMDVVLRTESGEAFRGVTPFVFIGNNRYAMDLLAMGARPRLDRGELSVYFSRRKGRFSLVRIMLRGLLGRLDQARDFDTHVAREVRIETRKHSVRVAFDGEVRSLTPPLCYRIHAGALRVLTSV